MNNQMNSAVRKIHNLLSSGAVTVTGPNQPRLLKKQVGGTTTTASTTLTAGNSLQHHGGGGGGGNRCYVCDEGPSTSQAQHQLTEMQTSHTTTKFPNKIGQLVGDAFMVIVSVEDVICSRCTNLINYLDRLENDVERVRTNLMNLLHKKYGLNDDSGGGGGSTASPPIKMQKLNSGGVLGRDDNTQSDLVRTRKLLQAGDSAGKQSPPVSAVQQIKIATTPTQQHQSTPTAAAGTQTAGRKMTRIYKCLSCDYKTSDMRLFNTHYETCKHQNFQCKNCKKIFPNFGAMKQHMVREHNTPMDNTCSVCHFNFLNEAALRKHMEANHSTSVVVTSTTTLPAAVAAAAAAANEAQQQQQQQQQQPQQQQHQYQSGITSTTATLYTCNHCQFKSTDKGIFDEHLRKHMAGGGVVVSKPKPFKCRLCAQRFETREAATVHAKQHQTNYFKCGTCAMSFPKRELLVKHFEVHQQQQQQSSPSVVTVKHATVSQQQQQQQQQQLVTTQKLLQETIDEALSDNVSVPASNAATGGDVSSNAAAAANNIRFFSCHICSLTFIQENYYNQHMETHRRDAKKSNSGGGGGGGNAIGSGGSTGHASGGGGGVGGGGGNSSLATLNSAAAMLGDDLDKVHDEVNGGGGAGVGVHGGGGDGRQAVGSSAGGGGGGQGAVNNLDADIESIFEKMHSDKNDTTADSAGGSSAAQAGDSLVITSQEGSAGGITFNITIPQPADTVGGQESEAQKGGTSSGVGGVGIDMPMLDQPDETGGGGSVNAADGGEGKMDQGDDKSGAGGGGGGGPVSMPSLDDDGETGGDSKQHHEEEGLKEDDSAGLETGGGANQQAKHEAGDGGMPDGGGGGDDADAMAGAAGEVDGGGAQQQQQQHVAMELDEAMQAQVESGQIKFILNENGQLLQLDNHIITDADGNQILVQDPEQIQQLLQSVGVLQSGDGLVDGETLQMMTDGNGQMVLVHGENNETQLIDASLLNADGQLVIQPGQEGELGEGGGAHVISEDGTRIPVSVSYTADGEPIVQVQQQVLEAAAGGGGEAGVVVGDHGGVGGHGHELDKEVVESHGVIEPAEPGDDVAGDDEEGGDAAGGDGGGGGATTSGGATVSSSAGSGGGGGGGFYALDELMQQSAEAAAAAAATSPAAATTSAAGDSKAAE